MVLRQKSITLSTSGRKKIYGTFTPSQKKSKHLIIFVHGLTGHQNEHIFFNAAQYFPRHGFNVFRFDLYSGEKGGRNFIDTTVPIHVHDINTVITHFQKKKFHIHLVGHSLGGPCVLLSNLSLVKSVVLWDPSYNLFKKLPSYVWKVKSTPFFAIDWGIPQLASKEFIKSLRKASAQSLKLKKALFALPIKLVFAGDGVLFKHAGAYLHLFSGQKESVIIKEADHNFNSLETESELFKETLSWFRKYN